MNEFPMVGWRARVVCSVVALLSMVVGYIVFRILTVYEMPLVALVVIGVVVLAAVLTWYRAAGLYKGLYKPVPDLRTRVVGTVLGILALAVGIIVFRTLTADYEMPLVGLVVFGVFALTVVLTWHGAGLYTPIPGSAPRSQVDP